MIQVLAEGPNNLSQSSDWADFQAALGRRSWVVEAGGVRGLVLEYPLLKNGHYLYSPRGPVTGAAAAAPALKPYLEKVAALAAEEREVFYRVEPYVFDLAGLLAAGFKRKGRHAPLSAQFSPENTLVLDLEGPEEEILAGMKSKCRYNIRLADRKGVNVRVGRDPIDIEIFYDLTTEMEKRGGYRGHEFQYYRKMFDVLSARDILMLYIAEHEGRPLASILVSFYGRVATYLHGASGDEKRELMPTYALQWEAIREAKRRGCAVYDFWGVAPEGARNHPWAGISRFKRGFGGQELHFGGACDLPFGRGYYRLLSAANRMRKAARRQG